MKKSNPLFLAAVILLMSSCTKSNVPDKQLKASADELPKTSNSVSPAGDVVGKLVVGYQGWFACPGDGSPKNSWIHWGGNPPSPGNQTFELWPDVSEYPQTFQTGYANLGNGQPAKLFSSYPNSVVDKHLEWMQTYGIDCAAVQRFRVTPSDPTTKAFRDGIATKVRNAAQTYGRKFYIMYDISGWNDFQTEIKTDWTNTITGSLNLTSSAAYAKQNGKTVVCIWGLGVQGRPGNAASWLDLINWFKSKGCYVIIGTPKNWRTDTANLSAYNAADMVSPWTVGSYKGMAGADNYAAQLEADFNYLSARGQDYQPVAFPGFAWSNWNGGPQNDFPRTHGDFLWHQFANIRNKAIPNAYVAMFDEYDEGTAIAKAAVNVSQIPTNQYFLTLDADGVTVSSDFYLRLTGDGAKMIKNQTALTFNHPTSHQ